MCVRAFVHVCVLVRVCASVWVRVSVCLSDYMTEIRKTKRLNVSIH